MWTQFYFKEGSLYGTVNLEEPTNRVVRFIILNITNTSNDKSYWESKKSELISNYINDSKTNERMIEFSTSKFNSKDELVIELYKCGNYFSKKLLDLLVKVKSDLEVKKKNRIEKLEEFLFRT